MTMEGEIPIKGADISSDAKELVSKGNAPSDKETKEKSDALVQRLRSYADSYDLLQQEALLKAINEAVRTYNSNHKDGQITPLEVYTWILGDKTQAADAMRRAGNAETLRAAQGKQPEEKSAKKVNEEPAEKIGAVSELSTDFINSLRTKKVQGIQFDELERFLQTVSKASAENGTAESVGRVLMERKREVDEFPERAATIVKVLISGIKAIFNRAKNPDKKEAFGFDERATKAAIITEKREVNAKDREIMSNNEGRISDVTVILAAKEDFAEGHYHVLAQLMEAKQNESPFTLTCVYSREAERDNFLRYLQESKIKFPLPKVEFARAGDVVRKSTGNPFSTPPWVIWARDGAVRRKDGTVLEPKRFRLSNPLGFDAAYDKIVPIQGTDLEQSELSFEGGNIRAGSNYVLVGYDCISRTAHDLNKTDDRKSPTKEQISDTVQRFEKEFGKKVIVIGSEDREQPVYHIDMCITPLDDKTMAVAKPLFGADKMQKACEQLEQAGFKVVRVPYTELPDPKGVAVGIEMTETYLSYNNALVEQYRSSEGKDVRRIYLPQYYAGTKEKPVYSFMNGARQIDLARTNAEAAAVYRKQGFEVVPIQVSVSIPAKGGSLNCLTFEQREQAKR